MPYQGLKKSEVADCRKKYGWNKLPSREKYAWPSILLGQFKSPLIYILLFAGAISFYFREYHDLWLIGAVLVLNVVMGFYQEYSAQKTLAALKNIVKFKATVIRDGERQEIETKELVPGDIVILYSGDRVPADGRLLEGFNLLASEAVLTGEAEAVSKMPQKNFDRLFMGTTIIAGTGLMKVENIGQKTEIGKIGKSLEEIKKEKTPLQKKLEKLSRGLAFFIGWICLAVFLVEIIFYNQNIWEMLRIAVILAVAAVPEGLPIAITVIMALGMRRILKKKGLVKRLLSIETLGSTSVICTDKTGTLTEGVMKVEKVNFVDEKKALLAMVLANERRTNMEVALWEYAQKLFKKNPEKIIAGYPRLHLEPFDSEKKYSLTVNKMNGRDAAFILGAPEIVLLFCGAGAKEKKEILRKIENLAEAGLRILGAATKETGDLLKKENFKWLGLIGVEDPIRESAKEAVARAQAAGIRVIIVTGDYRKTAEKVALELGLAVAPKNIIEGKELEKMSGENLREKINSATLFTRVTPIQKLKIIEALQNNNEIVAMTGDGVNDAPALKKANIGVVVGSATDVAKEAGDLILLDNNFKTIVEAVEEGRLVFANMKKVVGYALSNSFAEIVLIFGAMLLHFPLPLAVVQILWIHLICDGPPDIILSFEPKEKDTMKEDPRALGRAAILDGSMKFLIAAVSSLAGISALAAFWYFQNKTGDLALARTVAFATLAIVDLVYIFSFKSSKKSIFKTENFWKNKLLLWSVLYGFVLCFAAIYIPALNRAVGTVPLKASHWILPFGIAIFITLVIEITKLFKKDRKTV